jgi:hypothetical protein
MKLPQRLVSGTGDQTTNLRVGGSNPSERANHLNDLEADGADDRPTLDFCGPHADPRESNSRPYWPFRSARPRQQITHRAVVPSPVRICCPLVAPWEAIEMGLEVETVKRSDRRKPVANYVREHKGRDWEEWLQTHRIELNAMTTPQLIEWLDEKLAPYEGKLIPPNDVLTTELTERIEEKVRAATTERILREAGFERQVAKTIAAIKMPSAADVVTGIKKLFEKTPDREWRDYIEARAAALTKDEDVDR